MSDLVDLTEFVRVLERFDYAYLMTTDAACRPHVSRSPPPSSKAA
jgi:hypothetical protein